MVWLEKRMRSLRRNPVRLGARQLTSFCGDVNVIAKQRFTYGAARPDKKSTAGRGVSGAAPIARTFSGAARARHCAGERRAGNPRCRLRSPTDPMRRRSFGCAVAPARIHLFVTADHEDREEEWRRWLTKNLPPLDGEQ